MEQRAENKLDRFAVQTILSSKNAPVAFKWLGRVYRVKKVQECWRLMGAWWDGEGERTFFRVQSDKGGIYDLRFDHARSVWTMDVVQD